MYRAICMRSLSYLDYNATAPVRPAVIDAMREMLERTGNPSSVHRFGREARRTLEQSRELVAAMVGAAPGQVVFTSGGTEANNQALRSAHGPVVVSAIEHDSVLAAVPDALRMPVDAEGRIDIGALERALARLAPELVSVMLANNETGVIQPVREVVEVARRHGARVHCDAVQAGGKLALDMAALGVDFLTLSAHKFGGPQGVGALVVRDGLEPDALLRGGGQERRWRPGTENLPGIVGFGRACELAMADTDWRERTGALRDRLEARIAALAPAARIFGRSAERLPNTSCLTMPDVSNQTQLIEFDLAGIAVSTGSACSSGKVGPSHVLAAMGVDPTEAASAIRISLGWASTQEDIDRFVDAWGRLYVRTRRTATDAIARPA
jgi:cysteine desulfurase